MSASFLGLHFESLSDMQGRHETYFLCSVFGLQEWPKGSRDKKELTVIQVMISVLGKRGKRARSYKM